MGTKLGNPNFSLEYDASPEFRLVAATCPQHPAQLPSFPHRSRARLLSHLRLSLPSAADQEVSPAGMGPSARANRSSAAALPTAGRFDRGRVRSNSHARAD